MKAKRESKYVRSARIAYRLAQASLPQYSHPKSPQLYTLPQLAACVLLKFYLNLSYRDTEEWLLATDAVCQVLGLESVPTYSTLQRTAKKLRIRDIERMQQQLLTEVEIDEEESIALDGTGFTPSQASWYYQTRSGRQYRRWLKGVYAIGTKSQFILATRVEWGPSNDVNALTPLRRRASRYGCHQRGRRTWLLLADAGFDGKTVQSGDLIPPVRRHGTLADPQRRARADLVAAARLDGLYGQRWKCETVNSVLKRRFGATITARSHRLQWREPYFKALVYNIHR